MYDKFYKPVLEKMTIAFEPIGNLKDNCVDNTCKAIKLNKDMAETYSNVFISQLEGANNIKELNSFIKYNEQTMANMAMLSNKNIENLIAMKEMLSIFKNDMVPPQKEAYVPTSKKAS